MSRVARMALLLALTGGVSGGCGVTGAGGGEKPIAPPPAVQVQAVPVAEAAPALQDDPRGGTPKDLEVDVTVLVAGGGEENLRVEDRTGRYVLFPDGALHAETGAYLDRSARPGRARWLYQQQVSELWGMCRQIGFADPANANGPANPDMLHLERKERLIIIAINADGKRWSFVSRGGIDEPADPAAARLVRSLAALAWIPDFSPYQVAPERYDYGPDPYAAYRIPSASREERR